MMKAMRLHLLASTILTGLAVAAAGPGAQADPLHGVVIAQAGTPNQAEQRRREQKKVPPHPAPKRPAPPAHPPAPHPAPAHPPAPHAPPPPRAVQHPPQVPQTPHVPPHRIEQHAPKPAPHNAQPPAPNRNRPNEHFKPNTPAGQAQPHAAVPPVPGAHGAGTPPPNRNVGGRAFTPQTQQRGAGVQRAAPGRNPAAVPPPTHAISKQQFIVPRGQTPTAGMTQVRAERHETRQGNRLFIHEPGRTIIEENNHTIIRHNEVDRFAVGARNVRFEHRGNETVTIVMRPDGVEIIDFTDADGHLLRRVRRDRDGREFVIIDNTFAGGQPAPEFLDLPPPVVRMPRDRYIVDADAADEAAIYGVFTAPPIERIGRRYTLDQVRYNEPLRALMPRIDLEINFDTGSWELTPDQVDKLSLIAEALNRAIERNPREVFLVEGYTDAVGSAIDNLSLSDRRAESVAVALTEGFHVPAENLVTQGYGKEFLKIQTAGPERANRRVAIQRITPLIDPQAANLP